MARPAESCGAIHFLKKSCVNHVEASFLFYRIPANRVHGSAWMVTRSHPMKYGKIEKFKIAIIILYLFYKVIPAACRTGALPPYHLF